MDLFEKYRMRWFFFPLLLFYYEMVLHFSTVRRLSLLPLLITLLFSAAYGLALELLRSVFLSERAVRRVTTAMILLTALPYLVLFFMHREFKMYYDLNTIFFGAGGALSEFIGEIASMIFSADGLLHIALFLLPLLLYRLVLVYMKKMAYPFEHPYQAEHRAGLFICCTILFILGAGLLRKEPSLRYTYAEAYQFGNVVEELGVLPALQADVVRLAAGEVMEEDFVFVAEEPQQRTSVTALSGEEAADNASGALTADAEDGASAGVSEAGSGTTSSGADETSATDSGTTSSRAGTTATDEATTADSGATTATDEATTADSGAVEEEEPVYAPNALPIDFGKLAEGSYGAFAKVDQYLATLTPSMQNEFTGMFKGKNLILIAAEAFSGYMIDEELTPTLYRMHTKGFCFTNFYQPSGAGTTGGEYNILHGLLPMAGGASMNYKADDHNVMTIGSYLDRQGYYGKLYHNGTLTFYDRHRTHVKLGYSDGYTAVGNGLEKIITEGSVYSDYGMFRDTFPLYADEQPFNVYYMTISGHAPYSRGGNYFSSRHWERVKDLPYSDSVKAYIASNLELEDSMAFLIDALEKKGIADDTVIVVCADHFPYGLSDKHLSELYGAPVTSSLFRDSNTLLIWCGELEQREPVVIDAPVVSLDILPTLLNLFGLDWDSRLLPGRDVFSDAEAIAFDMGYNWATELGVFAHGRFTPAEGVSEEDIPEGYVERVKQIVSNKITLCRNLTYNDYYGHVFGDEAPEDLLKIRPKPEQDKGRDEEE
ncbi:MAG: LTA synthase family protein [Lachnospiraceae bacterium]|nr:LTA synthase family protein [Lachnospiraceae bacterium]